MISPLAYVDASAKLGANVTVHPFAYVDKNVEIGDDCEIMPHVSIMSGTRMGTASSMVLSLLPNRMILTIREMIRSSKSEMTM